MIEAASAKNTKIILLTPTPDLALNILNTANILHVHPRQISGLANKYQTGIVDSMSYFTGKRKMGTICLPLCRKATTRMKEGMNW